ncbi:MAG TPA: Rieske (2Fe-2S) protein [Stellaceae bacterium]|jgi:nitrite reductase/ring-hydroxylating ferredoxin subunit|nr:Rieske (2Fe-2S) protein [Stellaceae bacterium]
MELPPSLASLGDRLADAGEIAPHPDWLGSAEVFAAERERIFVRPWIAVDHQSRLDADHRYFRFDSGGRSVLVTRAEGGALHALRNVCIHAGYPVCEAEEGPAERLVCPYHGWEFSTDGRLLEPNLSARIDPARLRLGRYGVCVRDGLIFVDLSGRADPAASNATVLPAWLSDAVVTRRARWNTEWNWKELLQFVRSAALPVLDAPAAPDAWQPLGPLSFVLAREDRAALLRVIPKFARQTDLQLIELAAAPPPAASLDEEDGIAELLRRTPAAVLDRAFFAWYWPLLSVSEVSAAGADRP